MSLKGLKWAASLSRELLKPDNLKMMPALIAGGIDLHAQPPRPSKRMDLRFENTKLWGENTLIFELSLKGEDARIPCSVAVDLKKGRLDWSHTTSELFRREHNEGAIGVALLSLPFMVPIFPVLSGYNWYHSRREKTAGMCRHSIALLEQLKENGPISSDNYDLLEHAFKGQYEYERDYLYHQPSYKEAQALLNASRLDLYHYPPREDRHRYQNDDVKSYAWHDEKGELVAKSSMVNGEILDMNVLGSCYPYGGGQHEDSWTEEQWLALHDCHAGITTHTR